MTYQRNGILLGIEFREYLIPTIISNMSILIASFVDGIIVAKLINDDAFSAVNLAEPVVLFMQALFFLFGIGGAICISIAKGQRDKHKANAVFTLSFISSVAVAAIVTVAGVLLIDPITRLLCSESMLYDYVRSYALFNIIGSIFMIVVPYLVFIIRTDGLPKFSASILLVSNLVNLLLDFVYMGVFKMGTTGAALATVTGYVVGFLMELYYLLFSKKRTLRFIRLHKPDLQYMGEFVTGGIASVVNTILLFVKAILLNKLVLATSGADGMAVFSVCNFSVTFISMFVSGGSDTMSPIIGMLYGERDYKGIDIVLRKTFVFVVASCTVIVAAIFLFPQLLLQLFSVTSPARIAMGIPAIRIFSLSLIGMGVCVVMMNYLQVTKHKAISVTITFLRGLIITVPLAYLLAGMFRLTGVSMAFALSEALTAAIGCLICFIVSRIKKDKYSGVLLHERQTENSVLFDASLRPEAEQAAGISDEIISFCGENGVDEKAANYAGVLAEEIVEHIRFHNLNNKQPQIDLICRVTEKEVIMSVRDNGETFDAAKVDEGNDFTNLQMIHSLADSTEYTRTLGLNNMLVKLKRT